MLVHFNNLIFLLQPNTQNLQIKEGVLTLLQWPYFKETVAEWLDSPSPGHRSWINHFHFLNYY